MAITQPTKPTIDQGSTDIPDELDIYFNGVEYKPTRKAIQEITFLGIKTMQAKVKENLTIFWNPLTWDWTKLSDKEAYENKYKRKTNL